MDNFRDLLHFEAYLVVMSSDRLLIRDTTFLPTHHRRLTLDLPNSQFKGFERNRASNHAHGADRPVPGPAKKKNIPVLPYQEHPWFTLTPRLQPPLMPSGMGQKIHSHKPRPQIDWAGSKPTTHQQGWSIVTRGKRLERKRFWTRAHGWGGGDHDANDWRSRAAKTCFLEECHYASRRMHRSAGPFCWGLAWSGVFGCPFRRSKVESDRW
jgi:hypothetical protein